MSTDIIERIAAAKKQVEALKSELVVTRDEKMKNFSGFNGTNLTNHSLIGPKPKIRRYLKGHFGKVYAMHWASNSKDLVSASQDGKLIVWNAMANTKSHVIPLRSSWVMTCAFEQSKGNMVAAGGLDNVCSIYKLDQPQFTRAHRELAGHEGYLSFCRFIDEGSILTASGDSTCLLWDIESGKSTQSFTDHSADVMSLSILPDVDPNMFVSGSCDSTAKIWDVRTGKCTMTLRGHESDINSVILFPDAKTFGTGSDDSSCKIFDIRACGEVCEFKNEFVLCGVTSVAASRSGRFLFAGYDDYNCLGWDLLGSPTKNVFQLQGHDNRVSTVGVAPNGEALCTGSWDQQLKIWA